MATLTFSFDTGNVPISRIVDAIAVHFSYPTEVRNPEYTGGQDKPFSIPNPETKAQFAKKQVKRFITEIVHKVEKDEAASIAQAAVSPITLTD